MTLLYSGQNLTTTTIMNKLFGMHIQAVAATSNYITYPTSQLSGERYSKGEKFASLSKKFENDSKYRLVGIHAGLEITAGQRTMSGQIVDLTGQTFVLPVTLTGQNSIVLKMK